MIYDKKTTWHKSMKETLRRDNDLLVTMENAAEDKNEEYKHKVALEQLECQLRKEEEEAVEAKQLLKENADARVERTRQRFSEEFDIYMNRWRREEGRVSFLSTQMSRKSQSSESKSLIIEKDLNEISSIVQRMMAMLLRKTASCGENKNTTLQREVSCSNMDDMVSMAAEWCSFADTARLRRVSTRCLQTLCDWPFQQLVLQLDEKIWESSSREWDWYMNERILSPEM